MHLRDGRGAPHVSPAGVLVYVVYTGLAVRCDHCGAVSTHLVADLRGIARISLLWSFVHLLVVVRKICLCLVQYNTIWYVRFNFCKCGESAPALHLVADLQRATVSTRGAARLSRRFNSCFVSNTNAFRFLGDLLPARNLLPSVPLSQLILPKPRLHCQQGS
jgi:hypothetical protein